MMTPIGQSWLVRTLGLRVLPPAHESFVVAGARKTEVHDGRRTEFFPKHYAIEEDPVAHLKFAMRHEPFDMGVLVAALRDVGPARIERWLRDEPTGAYARRAWFLYETLVGKTLDVDNVKRGDYVDALDDEHHVVAPPRRSPRHRVNDNLLGGAGFCATVRRTAKLDALVASGIDAEARALVASYDPLLLARAVSYLFTKETKSSFAIERESAEDQRAQRFIQALRDARSFDPTDKAQLVELQGRIVDTRYAATNWRDTQNFVGETIGGHRQRVHFISPRPEDVPALMSAWMGHFARISAVDPVVAAAVLSFAFVLIHPFDDGNGRLHRFLVHHVLSRRGFSPDEMIFPVSAAILRERRSYDDVLESFSRPLLPLVSWSWTADAEINVENDTADLYRYFDATRFCEYLYERVIDTVRRDLKEELEYVARYDSALRAARAVVDMPDKKASLFVRLVLENSGKLSRAKRTTHFAELSDDEVAALEAAVSRAM